MKVLKMTLLMLLASFGMIAAAQFPGSEEMGGGRGMGGMMTPRTQAELQLKAQFPSEFAEIEKTRLELENKIQALAKKAGMTLPETMETFLLKFDALRGDPKFTADFKELDRLRKEDPRAGRRKMQEIVKKSGLTIPARAGSGMGGARPAGGTPGKEPVKREPVKTINLWNEIKVRKCFRDANGDSYCDNGSKQGGRCQNNCKKVTDGSDSAKKTTAKTSLPCANCPFAGSCKGACLGLSMN